MRAGASCCRPSAAQVTQSCAGWAAGVDVVRRPAGLPPSVAWLESPGGADLPPALEDLPAALVVAHEWLDVVPCDVLERGRVGATARGRGGRHRARAARPSATDEQEDWAARWWPPIRDRATEQATEQGTEQATEAAGGQRVEVGLARDRAWAGLLARVRSGVVLAVDYGHVAGDRPPTGSAGGAPGRAPGPARPGRQLRPHGRGGLGLPGRGRGRRGVDLNGHPAAAGAGQPTRCPARAGSRRRAAQLRR